MLARGANIASFIFFAVVFTWSSMPCVRDRIFSAWTLHIVSSVRVQLEPVRGEGLCAVAISCSLLWSKTRRGKQQCHSSPKKPQCTRRWRQRLETELRSGSQVHFCFFKRSHFYTLINKRENISVYFRNGQSQCSNRRVYIQRSVRPDDCMARGRPIFTHTV